MTDHHGSDRSHTHEAFGLQWSSDVPLHDFFAAPSSARHRKPDIIVEETVSLPATRRGLIPLNRGAVCSEGVRFQWGSEVAFDTYGADRVVWQAGREWTGRMPQPFFSTLTAILLGWRGMLPIHGSAVEIDGRGYLICGPSGAGKSTLAAGLVALGARLISDDLTGVTGGQDGTAPHLVRGRSGIRLVPEIADYFVQSVAQVGAPVRRDRKLLVRAGSVPPGMQVPLTGLVMRVAGDEPIAAIDDAALVRDQIFRKKWMAALPGRPVRDGLVQQIAAGVPVFTVRAEPLADRQGFLNQAARLMTRLA